ncbi:hypothetical protein Dimus_039334 [Dionaea muscipula]
MQAVISPYHPMSKFLQGKVGKMFGDQDTARRCYLVSLDSKAKPGDRTDSDDDETPGGIHCVEGPPEERAQPVEPLEEVFLVEGVSRSVVQIGTLMQPDLRLQLIDFLRQNRDVFALSTDEMVEISRDVIEHALSTNPTKRAIKQKRRRLGGERVDAVKEEVQKLLAARIIREVFYPEWLANSVLVKKPNGSWRMCIDFTDLNNACPKDSYPLPDIDTLVDPTSGHDMLSFMDAFSGYHQIRMRKDDEEKTAFITQDRTFCYKMMPFGLKNAGATYQRLVNKIFAPVLGKTFEAYVDDMLVKSVTENEHVTALESAFTILRKYP